MPKFYEVFGFKREFSFCGPVQSTAVKEPSGALRDRIACIDFLWVRERLKKKLSWTDERVAAAEANYKQFLFLIGRYPNEVIVPWLTGEGRDDLDEFWHYHILDTHAYVDDCARALGFFVHHDPNTTEDAEKHASAIAKTRNLYFDEFWTTPN